MNVSDKQINLYKELIAEFRELEPIPEYMPTIFEISGYPHYEDVMSNVLRFFFSSDYDHGFSTVFIGALLESIGEKEFNSSDLLVTNVEREYPTNAGNRIDLVIETETYCIAIEHKIHADLYNDLKEYQESIKNNYPDNRRKHVALSKGSKDKPKDWDNHKFKLVTYDQFFEKLEKRLGKHISDADSKILMYISDYIKTIRNLNKRTELTMEFIEFLKNNKPQVESLHKHAFVNFKNELKEKARGIDGEVNETGGFSPFHYNKPHALEYVQGYRKKMEWEGDELQMEIKLRMLPKQYVLEFWASDTPSKELFQNFIESRLNKDNFHIWKPHPENRNGSIKLKKFEYGEKLEDIANEIEDLIKIIASN